MRILQISSARTFGGGERHFAELCRGLQERGHEVFVALRPSNEWQDRLSFIPPENFLYVSIRNSFGMFSAKRIGNFLERKEIDIVHAHVARDYIAASIAARISKRTSLVLTRHVMFPLKPFHKLALRNVDAAIAVSPAVEVQLAKIFPQRKLHVIPLGITVSNAAETVLAGRQFRTFHGIPQEAMVIGTLGELKPLKGQMDFVLAANEIAKKYPDSYFVITGSDHSADGSYRRELKRMVKIFGLEDRFLWLDWLEDTAVFYEALDIFVSPSHTESFGLAMLEAMLRGRPVVATATDGAIELLGNTGVITPVKDPVGLKAGIADLIDNERKRVAIGAELQIQANHRFSVDRMIDATEAVYRSIKK